MQSGEDAITQAGRNLLISFRQSVAKELEAIVGESINAVYSSDALAEIIVNAVEGWAKNPEQTGEKLLCRKEIADEIEQLARQREKSLANMASVGYHR